MTVKGGKKPKTVTFDKGGNREEAKIKGNKVTVGEGLSADSGKKRERGRRRGEKTEKKSKKRKGFKKKYLSIS